MEGAPSASEAAPEDAAARDSVQQAALCNIAVDHAGGIELTSMDSFVSTPVTGVQGARGLPEGRLSPIFVNETEGNDAAMLPETNGGTERDAAKLLDTKGGSTERDDAAMPLVTTAEGPSAVMMYSDEGVAQRAERALDENAAESGADQPRRQSTRLSRANTGGETAGTSIDLRDTETLSKIQQCIPDGMWTSITSGKRNITVDLPLVANFVSGWYKPGKDSASKILDDIRRKDNWKLGTEETILKRFAANSVPLLHKTMMLLDLKEKLCVILEEWTKETPPLSPKPLQFPEFWPLDHAKADEANLAPAVTREWALDLLSRHCASSKIDIPGRTRAALQAYSAQPLDYLTGQCAPNRPAPPESQPTRPKPRQLTAQAKQGGGNRPMPSGNTPSFTERTAAWYESARCTLGFSGVSGGVHLKATLANLRKLLDAGPKTDLSGLRGIATDRRKQLDPEKVKRHFETGGQRAEAAYYASVLAQLYSDITKLREARADGKPTGEIRPNQIGALGFPAGPSPQETRNAVVAWGKFHMGTWGRDDPAGTALRLAMAAYVKNTVEPNPESRNVHTAQGSQPSVRLSPTHETDSAERARRWELAERTQACVIYCRGEIPSWTRNYSPLGDLHFIRSMNVPEQIAFVTEITAAGATDFIAASTDAVLQEREQAEVRKYTSNGRTPPWYAPDGHTETPNFAVRDSDNPHGRSSSSSGSSNQGNTSDRDYLERFQTSPVTARNLPDASLATPSQTRRDRSATQTQTTNRFAPLGEKEDDEAEADPYDPDDEPYMIFLQQPSAGVTVRTMQPIFPPAPELRPPTVVDDPASVVKALDRVSWDELITPANLITMREIPTELQEDVLGAMRDILKNMNDAMEGPEVEFERWYKLWELFPLLFLRMPPRGGRRGHGMIASRLDAHKQRNYDLLLDWYFSDREIAGRAPRGARSENRDRKLKQVLEHTKAGQYSKAMRKLTSNGIGDSKRKDIQAQMRKKFPPRKHHVGPLSEYLGIGTPVVTKVTGAQIARAIRNLEPGTAPGPDGFHSEHFKLTLKVQNLEIGRDVNTEMARFATAFGAGLLPAHTYYIGSGSWLVPVIKAKLTGAEVEVPCRPVCIGPMLARILTSTIVTVNADNLQEAYLPQQLGFHQNGCEMVPLTVQLHLELHPSHAAIKLDNENHFGEVMRHAALQFCASRPKLAPFIPTLHALHEYGSPLHYHDGERADDTVEGGMQGSVVSGHLAALALQPVLIAADSALKESDGFAVAIIDDGYLCGHPEALAAVFPQYKANLKEIGGTLNEAKGAALLGATCELPADFPVPRGVIYDGPGGKTGNIVGYGIICVGVPIGDPAFVKRVMELKEEETFDKIDRTVELLGPSQSFTGLQLTRMCLNPMMDYLGRGMDASSSTLPFFMRFDEKILDTVATLIGQGAKWPSDGTAHLGRDAWELVNERIRLPKRLGGLGISAAVSKCPVGRVACVIDCVRRGMGSAEVRNQGSSNQTPARIPLFPANILDKLRLTTGGSLVGMKSFLRLQTSIGDAFEINWAACQQSANEGTQLDLARIETPLNWPAKHAGRSVDGTPLAQTQKTLWRQVAKATATDLDMRIRALNPANPVQMAWINRDRHSTMFASVIPTAQYNLTNEELWCAAASSLGIENPVCLPHIGTSLVRKAPEEGEDDDDTGRRGDEVDAFGFAVSARVQQGGPWKKRHDNFQDLIVRMMQFSGVPAKGEPRNVVNGQIPRPLLREHTQDDSAHRVLQGAVPDVAYTNPSDGQEKIVELKFINQCPSRYGCDVATSLRTAVNKREQQLYQEYLTRLRLKDRDHFHTPDGTVGPLERGLKNATKSGQNFVGWVVGFYSEWSDELTKLPEMLADAQVVRWQSKYGREPTIQQRAWLLNKIRTDIAMMATKLNAQVIIKNLQNMHEKSLPPTGTRRRMELAYQDWARLQGRGPHTGGPFDRTIGWRSW